MTLSKKLELPSPDAEGADGPDCEDVRRYLVVKKDITSDLHRNVSIYNFSFISTLFSDRFDFKQEFVWFVSLLFP